jgi:hypothetical protein
VYSTCLFCHASLGKNESIEHFPVGRRLAFDAAKGRLWVVCVACERWNLSPLEERWDAIEECEREFRGTKLRVSTDHVGLARLREGTTLIRIGAPQRPELAAWRYGDQFHRRRRGYLALTAAGIGVGGLFMGGTVALGVASTSVLLGGSTVLLNLIGAGTAAGPARIAQLFSASRRDLGVEAAGKRHTVRRWQVQDTRLRQVAGSDFEIELPFAKPWWTTPGWSNPLIFRGDEALRVARYVLPKINVQGAGKRVVRDAVDLLETAPRVHDMFRQFAATRQVGDAHSWSDRARQIRAERVAGLPAASRLALEMALHEDDERRALEGELAVLEARWKEAEEIAAISDSMFVPAWIVDRLRGTKRD